MGTEYIQGEKRQNPVFTWEAVTLPFSPMLASVH